MLLRFCIAPCLLNPASLPLGELQLLSLLSLNLLIVSIVSESQALDQTCYAFPSTSGSLENMFPKILTGPWPPASEGPIPAQKPLETTFSFSSLFHSSYLEYFLHFKCPFFSASSLNTSLVLVLRQKQGPSYLQFLPLPLSCDRKVFFFHLSERSQDMAGTCRSDDSLLGCLVSHHVAPRLNSYQVTLSKATSDPVAKLGVGTVQSSTLLILTVWYHPTPSFGFCDTAFSDFSPNLSVLLTFPFGILFLCLFLSC